MAIDQGLVNWVAEAMAPAGEVSARKMFGGAGLYCGGLIFALLAADDLWFKSDAESDAEWDALGAERFAYEFDNGKTGVMNYRRCPGDAHDDADAMRGYGEIGLAAARRKASARPKKKRAAKAG
jgi:DNA transformation protein